MQVLELLQSNHKDITETLSKIIDSKPAETSKRLMLFQQLKNQIGILASVEEKIIFPLLGGHKNSEMDAVDACAELHLADILLRQLEKLPCDSELWAAGVYVLKENLEDYFVKEQQQIFAQIKLGKVSMVNGIAENGSVRHLM